MSDLSIGLVVEGPTDAIVIEAGLRSIIDRPFTYATLKPQLAPGVSDKGWGGVFHWCREVGSLGGGTLSSNPSLGMHDLVIVQVDADVAGFTYESANITYPGNSDLPCQMPCPPASDTVKALSVVINGWDSENSN